MREVAIGVRGEGRDPAEGIGDARQLAGRQVILVGHPLSVGAHDVGEPAHGVARRPELARRILDRR